MGKGKRIKSERLAQQEQQAIEASSQDAALFKIELIVRRTGAVDIKGPQNVSLAGLIDVVATAQKRLSQVLLQESQKIRELRPESNILKPGGDFPPAGQVIQ